MVRHLLLSKLTSGNRRSIEKANEVVWEVIENPALFDGVFNGMLSDNPLVRMRCADAVEKITSTHPEYLQPYKEKVIHQVATIKQQEVRWHVAQMLPRINLNQKERAIVFSILVEYLWDRSKIVKIFSMQALADLARTDKPSRKKVIPLLEELVKSGGLAMKSRGNKLLKELR